MDRLVSNASRSGPDLVVIIPCYNEYFRLPFDLIDNFLSLNKEATICFVNDGSTDKTQLILEVFRALHPYQVHVLILERNFGKAEAIRQGMKYACSNLSHNYIAFLDADFSVSLDEMSRVFSMMLAKEMLCVFGSRIDTFGTSVIRYTHRHYAGRLFAIIAKKILNMKIYDTQCGLKIFHKIVAEKIFEASFINQWLFDLEIFARMKLHYKPSILNQIMLEVPVSRWHESGNSKIRFIHFLAMPLSLAKIWLKYNKKTN